MPSIAETIQSWREQKINGTQFMRILVSHPHWSVPISEAAMIETLSTNTPPAIQYNRDPKGVNRLMIWSSSETLSTWAKNAQIDGNQNVITTTGSWVFGLPLDGIDEIWIDPLNAHDILYKQAQFSTLQDLAAAVAIEKDIADLRAGTAADGACVRVREYQKYLVAIAESAGSKRLLMAPDQQGRTLAAIFTTDDTFQAFTPDARAAAKPGEEVVCVQFSGKGLFPALAGMDLTGFVFNCSGPIKPIAFAAGFLKIVLDA
jgi:hypothetical protein